MLRQLMIVIILFGLLSVPVQAANKANKPLKVGFIMVGPVADLGWNYAHDQGRKFMETTLKGQVQTTVAENVPESAEVERVMEKMIAQGNELIFATSYGYLEPALNVAKRHPEVTIMHCGRSNPHPVKNVGSYGIEFSEHYFPMYACGIVAGRVTHTNKIGYVAAHPVPPLLLALNAFTLGAKSVNPKVRVQVVWTNSWSDPAIEAEAANGLIDQGVDVLAAHLDSTVTVVQTAEKHKLYSVGYHADVHQLAPKGWLTGTRWDFGPLYVTITKSVLSGNWKPGNLVLGANDGYGKLSVFGPAVSPALRETASASLKELQTGKLCLFQGPMKDRDGHQRIPPGKILSNDDLGKLDWVVEGISGSLPNKK